MNVFVLAVSAKRMFANVPQVYAVGDLKTKT